MTNFDVVNLLRRNVVSLSGFCTLIQKGNLLINENGSSTGFVNDYDGGMDFWPKGKVSDDQVFMPINVITFQKELNRISTGKKTIKFPEKQKQLIKLISESDASNNPILMMVKLKK
jgi:hypothetical protein